MSESSDIYGVSWQPAFVVVSVLLGAAPDLAVSAMGDRACAEARDLAVRLAKEPKQTRAVTMAREITKVVARLDEVAL